MTTHPDPHDTGDAKGGAAATDTQADAGGGEAIDDRFKRAKRIFSEDECAPAAEGIDEAWVRLFGEPRPKTAIAEADHGDCFVLEYPGGRFAQIGPPRCGWTEIRVLADPRP